MILLKEDRELSKGIFWFTCKFIEQEDGSNECDFSETELVYQDIPCNYEGEPLTSLEYNSKDGTSFTHKNTWKDLVKNKHDWNYYPRGRVEIRNNQALVFLNPNIYECKNYESIIKKAFNLNQPGLKIRFVTDNSEHYKCFADR